MEHSLCSSLASSSDSQSPEERIMAYALADEAGSLMALIEESAPMDLSLLRDEKGFTLLHIVCLNEQHTLLQYLIDYHLAYSPRRPLSTWLDQPTDEGFTPIHFATYRGNLVFMQFQFRV